MSTFTIDTRAKASITTQYARISFIPDARTAYRQAITAPIFMAISGSLPGEKYLIQPLIVQIEQEDGEFLVSEPRFFMHASGYSVAEAILHFKQILSEELDMLTTDEENLGPRLHAQLQYLRKAIRMA